MRKESTIAKFIDKDYNKQKYWKEKIQRQKENNIRKINVNSENILILGENARNTLILEK